MRHSALVSIAICLLTVTALAQSEPSGARQDLAVSLELAQEFYYAGDPLHVRITVRNVSQDKHPNPIRTPLARGLRVLAEGKKLEAKGQVGAGEPERPDSLEPQSFYGGDVNLVEMYPELGSPGTFEIYWSGSGLISRKVVVHVIPKYDPTKDYTSRIETEHGPILINLFEDKSPIAVKSFVDMAHAGLYDGLLFQEVHEDAFIIGGDPRFADPPRRAIQYPAEPSTLPLVAGTVIMKPASAAPPANGAEFIIMLKAQPEWAGQVTVLGQVVKGLDIVQKISRRPSSMRNARPFFKPLEDVMIREVTIEARSPAVPPAS